jgi:RNA polymerase sigma-70 factor (ECF subfamily)
MAARNPSPLPEEKETTLRAASSPSPEIDAEIQRLERRIVAGDKEALADLFAVYRPRLWRMVQFRMSTQILGRLDADDVLQEAWLNALQRRSHFLKEAGHHSYVWFRLIVQQTLADVHRRHLTAAKRSARRTVSLQARNDIAGSSSLALILPGGDRTASSEIGRRERSALITAALDSMNDIDKEILVLRHFEELSNAEVARALGTTPQAASARYVRALARLKVLLSGAIRPGGPPRSRPRREA